MSSAFAAELEELFGSQEAGKAWPMGTNRRVRLMAMGQLTRRLAVLEYEGQDTN